MYKVINRFTDLQDNNYPYNVGDIFPHDGLTVNEKRLKELLGSNNKQHKPLIKFVEDELSFTDNDIKSVEKHYTRTDINRMNKDDLISLANKAGIKRVEEYSGTDLRKELIEKLSL